MTIYKFILGTAFLFTTFIVEAQTTLKENDEKLEFEIDFVNKDSLYLVKLKSQQTPFYFYIISKEPIPELEDQDLFINIVDSENHGWPVIETGYIDTSYGVTEFAMDLKDKNFYLLGTNGSAYTKVNQFDFHQK